MDLTNENIFGKPVKESADALVKRIEKLEQFVNDFNSGKLECRADDEPRSYYVYLPYKEYPTTSFADLEFSDDEPRSFKTLPESYFVYAWPQALSPQCPECKNISLGGK